jgi:hypothetical protein
MNVTYAERAAWWPSQMSPGQQVDETDFVKHRALVERLGPEAVVDAVLSLATISGGGDLNIGVVF